MSKLLANQISNYNDNGPVEVKDGVNIPTGKPLQVAGGAGTSGQYLTSTGSSIAWSTLPSIPAAQVQTDWNASGTVAEILNKPTLATVATSGSYTDLLNTPTIPSAQVQSDWNASGTLAEILNKPTLFSGSYNDLTDKPTIPTTLGDFGIGTQDINFGSYRITYSNVYSTLTDLQAVSASTYHGMFAHVHSTGSGYFAHAGGWVELLDVNKSISKLADVYTTGVTDGQVLKWDAANSRWSPAADDNSGGGGGSTTFLGLTDTPANFTSQAGKYLKVNAGATALEYVTLPVDPDTNTTYSQSSVADGSNVKLRLTDSGSTDDDILITAGNNITISSVTAGGFTIASTGGGSGATVTTDDSAPSSPSDGDLWWKSDEGRLKVYYADANSSQWVDASPPANTDLDLTSFTGHILPATHDQQDIGSANKKIRDLYLGSNSLHLGTVDITESGGKLVLPAVEMTGHFIPDTNAAYDLGNAEYKIRHLFLSDNTMYFQGDFLKVAQHNSGGSAQSPSYLIPLAKLKDALNASNDYEAFKTAILAITDAT